MSVAKFEENLDKSADDLFTNYPVEEIQKLAYKLSAEVDTKRKELKLLVGNKYRDLLHVADDIIEMNKISSIENDELISLAYKKSNYNTKSLSNISKFNLVIETSKVENVQLKNRPIILRNIIHDLNYSLIILKHSLNKELSEETNNNTNNNISDDYNSEKSSTIQSTQITENLDYYQPIPTTISNNFILLSKFIYLIKLHFSDEIEQNPNLFSVIKFNQLCNEFNELIVSQIIRLKHEVDSQLIINLSLSYIIANKYKLDDIVHLVLNKRLGTFEKMTESKTPFQALLNYLFITITFVKSLQSRIPILISRYKSTSDISGWIKQTSFQKWHQWFVSKSNTKSDLFSNLGDYKLSSEQLDNILKEWKIKVSNLLLADFNTRFNKASGNLSDLVVLLKYVLISFKHFTSLSDLPYNNSKLISHIMNIWSSQYLNKLESKLGEFSDIGSLILNIFKNEELILDNLNKNVPLYDFSQDNDINEFLPKFLSKSDDNDDKILAALNNFKQDLKSANISVELLKNLSGMVLKPIITIDDFEDDDFWMNISKELKEILNENVIQSITNLNNSIQTFFENVLNILQKENSKISQLRIFYLIHILVQLEEKIQLDNIYEKFKTYLDVKIENEIKLNSLFEPLLNKSFNILVENIFENNYQGKINDLLVKRLKDSNDDYNEIFLWNVIEDRKIPNVFSFEYSGLLLNLCGDLMKTNNNDFAYLFSLNEFEEIRKSILSSIINGFEVFLTEHLEDFKSNDLLLLTFSDYLFTKYLINGQTAIQDESIPPKVEKLYDEFDDETRKQIATSIFDNYKNQYLLYYPLSK